MTDPTDLADRSAVVLAGAPTAAEGRDLALPRVVARATGVADDVVVNCRGSDAEAVRATLADVAPNARVAADPVADQGPVYGLLTGLRLARGDYAVVTAPGRPPADVPTVEELADALGDHDCAVPVMDGARGPLPGLFAVERTRSACDVALARGVEGLPGLLDLLDVVRVEGAGLRDPRPIADVEEGDAGTFAE